MTKTNHVSIGPRGAVTVVEKDYVPQPSPANAVRVEWADLAALIAYAKSQAWIP